MGKPPRRTRGWCAKFVSKRTFLGSSVAVVLQPLDRQHFDKWNRKTKKEDLLSSKQCKQWGHGFIILMEGRVMTDLGIYVFVGSD